MKKAKNIEIPARAPKICVIGHSGSGKSTLAAYLGERCAVPVLHIDTIQFLPGWVERDKSDRLRLMREFLDGNSERGWVIDGNYFTVEFERRMEESDLIVYLNFNRFVCLRRAYRRSREYKNRARPSVAEGCNEKFDKEFIAWVLRGGRTEAKLKRFSAIMENYSGKSVEIRNQRELDRFIKTLK